MRTKTIVNEIPKIGEKVYSTVMTNGLSVYIVKKEGFTNKYGVIATDFGSIDDKFIYDDTKEEVKLADGIAHFLEHKLFEEEFGSIEDRFAELGAYTNAFTNHTMTGYLFSCTDNFDESLELLLSFVSRPHFTDENVEKEKGIIAQEIKMYDDSPDWRGYSNFLSQMYHNHPVKIDIAGTVKSISAIDKESLYTCYNAFYHPTNMTLFIVGDIDIEETFDKISDITGKLTYPILRKVTKVQQDEPLFVKEHTTITNMEVSEPILFIGYKIGDTSFVSNDIMKTSLVSELFCELFIGNSSKLYQDLYKEGLIDKDFGAQAEIEKSYGFINFSGRAKDPKRLIEKINEAVNSFIDSGVDEEEFVRIKRKMMGSFIMGANSLEYIAYNFISHHISGMNFFEKLEAANELSQEDIDFFAKEILIYDNQVVSIIEPLKTRKL